MGNLLGEPFYPYVSSQIRARQQIHGKVQRTPEEISYLNSSNGWVKLASGVEISEERLKLLQVNGNLMATSVKTGKDLALNNVLFNGLSSYTEYVDEQIENDALAKGVTKEKARDLATKFNLDKARAGIGGANAAYGIDGTEFGYSPMPGIIDLNVKDLNRGSIKKATLTIKANNRNQLEIIDCLYMRLGYTVLLEWGHSKYWDDSLSPPSLVNQPPSLIDTEFFKSNKDKSDYTKFLPLIRDHKELTRGNYDAMFGTVSNFSWTFEPDGSYNCKIEIISLGDIIESLNININTGQSAAEATLQRNKIAIQSFTNKKASFERFYTELYPTLEKDLQDFYNSNTKALSEGNEDYYILNTKAGIGDERDDVSSVSRLVLSDTFGDNKYIQIWDDQFKFDNTLGLSGRERNTQRGGFIDVSNQDNIPSANLPTDPEIANDVGLQQVNINFVMDNNPNSTTNNILNNEAGRRVLQRYYASVLKKSLGDDSKGNQVLVKLNGKNSPNQKLNNVITSGSFYPENIVNNVNTAKYEVKYSGSFIPTEDNNFTGYLPEQLRGDLVLEGTLPPKPGELILNNKPIGFLQLARTGFRRQNFQSQNDGTVPFLQTRTTTFPFSSLQKQILAKLCTFDSFKQFIYDEFVKANRAGGAGDPRFKQQQPNEKADDTNENDGEVQLAKFLKISNEKSVRGNFFKYFYNIRTLYAPEAKASAESKKVAEDKSWIFNTEIPLNDIVEFVSIKTQPAIKAFGKIVGRVLNPKETSQEGKEKNWNSKVKYPLYVLDTPNSTTDPIGQNISFQQSNLNPLENFNQSIQNAITGKTNTYIPVNNKGEKLGDKPSVDFFKLNITNIDQSFYIRFGTLLGYLRDISIPGIDSNGTPPMIGIDMQSGTNVCYVIDNVISTNPRKVIIRNHHYFGGTDAYQDVFSNIEKYIEGDEEKGYYGNLMNVYLNFSRIEELLSNTDKNGNLPLFNFIDNICQDINESLGFINNLEPIVDKEYNIIKIIDQTVIPNAKEIFANELKTDEQATLEVFGYNNDQSNFVHNIGITSQISKDYATMITIGATSKGSIAGSEATAFSKWNIGITDRFKNNLTSAESAVSSTSNALEQLNKDNKLTIQNYSDNILREFQTLGFSDEELNGEIFLTFNNEFIKNTAKVCKDFYIYEQARSTLSEENEITETSIGFIPFNLKVDMDGLSGIKIYNRLKVNTGFLPSNYDKTLDFIVTGVNHQISDNKWTTSLETLATSKSVLGNKK
jgi:hypothetical protein